MVPENLGVPLQGDRDAGELCGGASRVPSTVSTKIGGAVTRSRCRRIIREGLRGVEKRGTLKQGYLIVIAARSSAPKLKSYDIEKNLDEAFKKLGMYEQ